MKWTAEQVDRLKSLCRSGKSNGELAEIFGVHKTEIYAKRSELHYTIAEVAAERAAKNLKGGKL